MFHKHVPLLCMLGFIAWTSCHGTAEYSGRLPIWFITTRISQALIRLWLLSQPTTTCTCLPSTNQCCFAVSGYGVNWSWATLPVSGVPFGPHGPPFRDSISLNVCLLFSSGRAQLFAEHSPAYQSIVHPLIVKLRYGFGGTSRPYN